MVNIHCEKCRFLTRSSETGYYCVKLKHALENGYAMMCHSLHCGEQLTETEMKYAQAVWSHAVLRGR